MDPVFVAATFGDRGYARVFLKRVGGGETVSLFSEGGEQARGIDLAGTRQAGEEVEIGKLVTAAVDLVVETVDTGDHSAKLRQEGFDKQACWLDDRLVGGQRSL